MIDAIAAAVGTPAYVYNADVLRSAYRRLDAAFGTAPHAIHYALKANSALAIVRLVRALGSGADANSMGEVDVALRCGFRPDEIVFTGVGKRGDELERAVALDLLAINVESPGELDRLARLAADRGAVARVALRVNPDIDAQSHPHISTGLKANKFGVPIDVAPALFREIAARPSLRAVGIHVHIGSQITVARSAAARGRGRRRARAGDLRGDGIAIEHLDFGGGVGIAYDGGTGPGCRRIRAPHRRRGRALRAEARDRAGARAGGRRRRAADAGRGREAPAGREAIRGARRRHDRADAARALRRVPSHRAGARAARRRRSPCDVVGPICESTDTFARDRVLPPMEVGDLVVIRDCGAYSAVMGSNYLRRPLPPEVLVDGGDWRVIRRRQTLDDMLALESELDTGTAIIRHDAGHVHRLRRPRSERQADAIRTAGRRPAPARSTGRVPVVP